MPQTSPGHQFEHLPLVLRDRGPTRAPRRQIPPDPTTEFNRANRLAHANGLTSHTSSVSTTWKASLQDRVRNGLPPTDAGIPLLLKIDTSLDLDDLRRQFEFEIVSEQADDRGIAAGCFDP